MDEIYSKYNLTPIINASGKMTSLGVSLYRTKAIEEQSKAGRKFFSMEELHKRIGRKVADLLGCESAYVVSSASAGIVQTIAGLIGKGSHYHLHNPYSSKFSMREVIILKGHNIDYGAPISTMIEMGGGCVVEAGYANQCSTQQIEDCINENTIAIFFVKSHHCVQKIYLQ